MEREIRNIVFIYSKDDKVRVFDLQTVSKKGFTDKLLEEGWRHTSTLDSNVFIEYLANSNNNDDIIQSVQDLSTYKEHK